ncbi:MAG: hypothetical protein M0026_06300 [Nocardiopsaceae bacterium]|nr:hypothetical protein [Nocardiopsaceae bacterium]
MIVAVIVFCETMFWVLLLAGLAVRYLLRRRRLSTLLLLLVPVLDVVLLTAIAVHLASGAAADSSHGIGALYLGFTVGYGHSTIRWVDARFAHRFGGGPTPAKPPARGRERLRYEWRAWLRGLVACAIGAAVLAGLTAAVGDPARTAALTGFYPPLATFLFVHTVISVWGAVEALLPAKEASPAPSAEVAAAGNGDRPPPADI